MVKCRGKKIVLSRKELSHVKRVNFKRKNWTNDDGWN